MSEEDEQIEKNIKFLHYYGGRRQGKATIGKALDKIFKSKLTQKEKQALVAEFHKAYPQIEEWIKKVKEKTNE